jgi:hypothetical protein
MRDILPEDVLKAIRDRYLAGVADAEAKFRFNRGSEDSLTGALGSELSMPSPMIFRTGRRSTNTKSITRGCAAKVPVLQRKPMGPMEFFRLRYAIAPAGPSVGRGYPFRRKSEEPEGRSLYRKHEV